VASSFLQIIFQTKPKIKKIKNKNKKIKKSSLKFVLKFQNKKKS
jgi:hypothetical protein